MIVNAYAAIWPIVRATVLEAARRKDIAVLAIFMVALLFVLGSARVVGLERPAAGTFLLNLSLTLIIGGAHLVTLLVAARQIPDEIEQRTLYPLLARPIRRSDVLIGKWLAAFLLGLLLMFCLFVPVWLLVPRLEHYETGTLIQLLTLQPLALMATAAVPLFLTLCLPRGLAMALALLIVIGADYLVRFVDGFPLIWLLPNPSRLNLVLRYTDGIAPLAWGSWAVLACAALLWTVSLLFMAKHLFERRAL